MWINDKIYYTNILTCTKCTDIITMSNIKTSFHLLKFGSSNHRQCFYKLKYREISCLWILIIKIIVVIRFHGAFKPYTWTIKGYSIWQNDILSYRADNSSPDSSHYSYHPGAFKTPCDREFIGRFRYVLRWQQNDKEVRGYDDGAQR